MIESMQDPLRLHKFPKYIMFTSVTIDAYHIPRNL